jgi:hypothetical protein
MNTNPYKFDAKNPRFVTNAERPSTVGLATGALFLASTYFYSRRYFRCDKNLVNMLAFSAASLPASYSYASFIFSSAQIEAAIINNQNELSH